MSTETMTVEQTRSQALRDAESKAVAMFDEIAKDFIRPGVTEKQLNQEIHQLGKDRHNVRTHWHKRLIRSGPNTLQPFSDNPPDRLIEQGDILVVDLGPVFAEWEADFGRTYVLGGDDAEKIKLRDALEPMWHKIKARYDQNPDMTGGELFDISVAMAKEDGWDWGAHIAGHTVGGKYCVPACMLRVSNADVLADFPHERIPNDQITNFITKGNTQKMSELDKNGHRRHWILEVHLRRTHGEYGGFFEQILTVD